MLKQTNQTTCVLQNLDSCATCRAPSALSTAAVRTASSCRIRVMTGTGSSSNIPTIGICVFRGEEKKETVNKTSQFSQTFKVLKQTNKKYIQCTFMKGEAGVLTCEFPSILLMFGVNHSVQLLPKSVQILFNFIHFWLTRTKRFRYFNVTCKCIFLKKVKDCANTSKQPLFLI